MMEAICDGLKGAYEESANAQRKLIANRREQAEKDLAGARERAAELRAKLKAARDLVGGNEGTDPQYTIRNLRQQRQSMEQQLKPVPGAAGRHRPGQRAARRGVGIGRQAPRAARE